MDESNRNMNLITMAHGAERKNVFSALSLHEDTSAIAHTRDRTVLLPEVHSKASTSSTVPKSEDAKWNAPPAGKDAKPGQVGLDHQFLCVF